MYSLGTKFFSAYTDLSKKVTARASENSTSVTTPADSEKKQFQPERIVIEKVSIDLPVVLAPLRNGTWDVIPKVANFAEGTSLVNDKEGNVGIFGHARLDAFKRIKELSVGDIVILYGKSYKATYIVSKTEAVAPNAVSVFSSREKQRF